MLLEWYQRGLTESGMESASKSDLAGKQLKGTEK